MVATAGAGARGIINEALIGSGGRRFTAADKIRRTARAGKGEHEPRGVGGDRPGEGALRERRHPYGSGGVDGAEAGVQSARGLGDREELTRGIADGVGATGSVDDSGIVVTGLVERRAGAGGAARPERAGLRPGGRAGEGAGGGDRTAEGRTGGKTEAVRGADFKITTVVKGQRQTDDDGAGSRVKPRKTPV